MLATCASRGMEEQQTVAGRVVGGGAVSAGRAVGGRGGTERIQSAGVRGKWRMNMWERDLTEDV